MIFANIMSHTATSSVMIPLGMAMLPQHKLEVSLIIGLASSTALFLPVSTPANAIAYSTGLIDFKRFPDRRHLNRAVRPGCDNPLGATN